MPASRKPTSKAVYNKGNLNPTKPSMEVPYTKSPVMSGGGKPVSSSPVLGGVPQPKMAANTAMVTRPEAIKPKATTNVNATEASKATTTKDIVKSIVPTTRSKPIK